MRLARLVLVSALLAACGSSKPAAQPPSAPSGLAATGGSGQISLTWTAVSGATYNVLRGDFSGHETQHATSSSASYTDASLPAATTYFYVVQAVKDGLTSGNSNEVSATTAAAAPAAPANVVASRGAGQIAPTLDAVAGATGYDVRRSHAAGGAKTSIATPTANSYTDAGLAAGVTKFYAVRATGPGG